MEITCFTAIHASYNFRKYQIYDESNDDWLWMKPKTLKQICRVSRKSKSSTIQQWNKLYQLQENM